MSDYETRRAAAAARPSGFYWVLTSGVVQVCRWFNLGDGDGTWYETGSEWDYCDSEVLVLSERLAIPEPNEGWPPEALEALRKQLA